jgi:hypothetical protein
VNGVVFAQGGAQLRAACVNGVVFAQGGAQLRAACVNGLVFAQGGAQLRAACVHVCLWCLPGECTAQRAVCACLGCAKVSAIDDHIILLFLPDVPHEVYVRKAPAQRAYYSDDGRTQHGSQALCSECQASGRRMLRCTAAASCIRFMPNNEPVTFIVLQMLSALLKP